MAELDFSWDGITDPDGGLLLLSEPLCGPFDGCEELVAAPLVVTAYAVVPTELLEISESILHRWAVQLQEKAAAADVRATYWSTEISLSDSVKALIETKPVFVLNQLDALQVSHPLSLVEALALFDRARASDSVTVTFAAALEVMLSVLARDMVRYADGYSIDDLVTALGQPQLQFYAQALEAVNASLATEQTLILAIDDTLSVQAADGFETLAHYIGTLLDSSTAWVGFRLSDDVVTGVVMNTEGEKPLSLYDNYAFNSMCRVGDHYLGARDEGLYLLDGQTDDGDPINAALRTMMIDFGSPRQKRVRSAYLGYTATGKLLLRVRSVDNGALEEQWYEAQELQAQAPRESMIRIGRGLRSRYWQFELVNVNGSDFELDTLELHPVYLNRRV